MYCSNFGANREEKREIGKKNNYVLAENLTEWATHFSTQSLRRDSPFLAVWTHSHRKIPAPTSLASGDEHRHILTLHYEKECVGDCAIERLFRLYRLIALWDRKFWFIFHHSSNCRCFYFCKITQQPLRVREPVSVILPYSMVQIQEFG